ncbi:MAG: hypothetical protein ACT4QD_11370 [Acidobacteriota bacterium]
MTNVVEVDAGRYCREIETYLCRKNDGHLIRVVGPAFERVAGWARDGIPITVVFEGINRYFERYYRRGPRRRPVRVEFCEADVRDAFDVWRRAVGTALVSASSSVAAGGAEATRDEEPNRPSRRKRSLAAHVERVVARLTMLRGSDSGLQGLDAVLAELIAALDGLKADAGRARGTAREQLLARLASEDRKLIEAALAACGESVRQTAETEARQALAPFRPRMTDEAYERAMASATARAVRDRFRLPTLTAE